MYGWRGDLKQLMNGFSELTMVCIELSVYGAIVRGSCKMSFLKRSFGVKKRHTHSFNLSTFYSFFFCSCFSPSFDYSVNSFYLCLNFNKSQLLTHFMYLPKKKKKCKWCWKNNRKPTSKILLLKTLTEDFGEDSSNWCGVSNGRHNSLESSKDEEAGSDNNICDFVILWCCFRLHQKMAKWRMMRMISGKKNDSMFLMNYACELGFM